MRFIILILSLFWNNFLLCYMEACKESQIDKAHTHNAPNLRLLEVMCHNFRQNSD